jgi:hypothetical protein
MKRKYFILLLVTIFLFVILRFPYRNFIYSKDIYDFYIASTAPNFLATFFYVFYYKYKNHDHYSTFFLVCVSLTGLFFYEGVIQQLLFFQTFDIYDLIASFLGSVVCFFTCLKIENKKLLEELKFRYPH